MNRSDMQLQPSRSNFSATEYLELATLGKQKQAREIRLDLDIQLGQTNIDIAKSVGQVEVESAKAMADMKIELYKSVKGDPSLLNSQKRLQLKRDYVEDMKLERQINPSYKVISFTEWLDQNGYKL